MILAIDPGEKHCGVALSRAKDGRSQTLWTATWEPQKLFEYLEASDEGLDIVIVESFHLYPWKMQEQGFSQLKTVEVIGVIRYLCAQQGIMIVEQPASIKKVTEGHMRAKGVQFAPGDRHAKDAQLHGWHYIWKQESGRAESSES